MEPAPPIVALAAGELEAEIAGGALLSVVSLRHRGEELLVDPGALPEGYRVHGARAGITLLHPWANRLGAARVELAGRTLDVAGAPVARDAAGLPIHGYAVPGTWTPEAVGPSSAAAVATFAALPAFPWAHRVEVGLALIAPAQLTVTTTLHAEDAEPVPVAFGWHPYFILPRTARPDWVLTLPARRHLHFDARGLPDGGTNAEPSEEAALGDRTFDDGYDEVAPGGVLALADAHRRITVRHHIGFPAAQVFAPADAVVVSLEPMTAPTDALRTRSGLHFAEPGTAWSTRFTVTVSAR